MGQSWGEAEGAAPAALPDSGELKLGAQGGGEPLLPPASVPPGCKQPGDPPVTGAEQDTEAEA